MPGSTWAVYVADKDTALLRTLTIAHRNGQVAEVLSGLEPGDQVILHPSDKVSPGIGIVDRSKM